MEPFDFKAVRAPSCNAAKFARPLAICLRIYFSFMYGMPFVWLHLYVCVCMKEEGRERRKEKGGVGFADDNLGGRVCVTEFAPT